jgi:hypothetical protein
VGKMWIRGVTQMREHDTHRPVGPVDGALADVCEVRPLRSVEADGGQRAHRRLHAAAATMGQYRQDLLIDAGATYVNDKAGGQS